MMKLYEALILAYGMIVAKGGIRIYTGKYRIIQDNTRTHQSLAAREEVHGTDGTR